MDVPAEFTQNAGDPGPVICSVAQTWGADLILMGRRGLSGLGELVLGSASNYVLHHAACSVLVMQGLIAAPAHAAPETVEHPVEPQVS